MPIARKRWQTTQYFTSVNATQLPLLERFGSEVAPFCESCNLIAPYACRGEVVPIRESQIITAMTGDQRFVVVDGRLPISES